MKSIRRLPALLALVMALAPSIGCAFGTFPHETHDPTICALPPCLSGDICAPFDAAPLWWAPMLRTSDAR